MKNSLMIILIGAISLFAPIQALAQNLDMRKDHLSMEQKRKAMEARAEEELDQAKKQAREKVLEIKNNKKTLEQSIFDLKAANKALKRENKGLQTRMITQKKDQAALQQDLDQVRSVNRELSGFVRSTAKDLESLLIQSLQSALIQNRHQFLSPMISQEKFPSMDDIKKMAEILFEEIEASGAVRITRTTIVDRQGKEREARVLVLGNFTGIYMLDGIRESEDQGRQEVGFLLYSEQSQRFFALSKLPSSAMVDQIKDYVQGKTLAVPVDISKGGALRQLTHELDLLEQVPKGGPIVWPILGLLAIALVILLERLFFFLSQQVRVEPFMARIRSFVANEDWEGCEKLLLSKKRCLIPKVLLTALPFRNQSRQDMENALQEAILGEIPRVERFLSTLGMLAAIAPLMGLLGTVTGMINTFHVITYYGAGDPRMMSGGISEALVTTMLGLSVAIPIMLVHTLLSRRVETQISQVEEKSVAFVNMVFTARKGQR